MSDDIELPELLPPVSGHRTTEEIREYARRAILADRAAREGEAWIPGEPPAGVDVAWLHVRYHGMDEEGGQEEVDKVVLGAKGEVPVDCEHSEEVWCEAADWKGEGYYDSVYEDGGVILAWMPYAVPKAFARAILAAGGRQ